MYGMDCSVQPVFRTPALASSPEPNATEAEKPSAAHALPEAFPANAIKAVTHSLSNALRIHLAIVFGVYR
jgi:hypothetical protein